MIRSGFENKKTRIELIPFIDVVFLLLVFFIYAMITMAVHKGLPVTLPWASTAVFNKDPFVTISVSSSNDLFIDEKPVALETLSRLIPKNNTVYIRADQKADAGMIIAILDVLRKEEIKTILFEARNKS